MEKKDKLVKEKKKVVIPKSAEYISEIFSEFLSGSYSNAEIGNIAYPFNLSDAIKKGSGSGPHTTTIQNIYDIWALIDEVQKKGWRITKIKGNYYVPQKVSNGSYDMEDLKKEISNIRKDIDEIKKILNKAKK